MLPEYTPASKARRPAGKCVAKATRCAQAWASDEKAAEKSKKGHGRLQGSSRSTAVNTAGSVKVNRVLGQPSASYEASLGTVCPVSRILQAKRTGVGRPFGMHTAKL